MSTSSKPSDGVLAAALFWAALAVSVELWWLDTAPGALASTGEVLVAAGRITGIAAGFVLLVQVLMMSRARWLERAVGPQALMVWHRELGGVLVVTVLAHVALVVAGYAELARRPVVRQAWRMLTTYTDLLSASLATAVLVGVGVLAIRTVRRALPYEGWYFLHLAGYLVLLLSYGHQFADGQELAAGHVGRWYWLSLYVFVLGCLVWGRVIEPLRWNVRHRLRVMSVVPEGADMLSVYVTGRRLTGVQARAGQYFRWRFLTRGCWWQAHPFSLSAAPNDRWLRITVKVVGDHTRDLRSLRPGVRVFAEGPSGVLTAGRLVQRRALLIAWGSGIAPIRALLEDMPRGAAVIYRAGSARDLVFREELEWLARDRGARVWYVLGGRDEPGPKRLFTPRGMRQLVPDLRSRDVYLCGPAGLVADSAKLLRRLRVPRRQVHVDPFEF
jgi:predicted ferric reductase